MMMRNLPGGVERFEKLLRDQSRSPPRPDEQPRSPPLQTEAVHPAEQSTAQKALSFNPMTRKRANNKKNHDSDKAAFGDFDQANRDILAWKTENRNYGSEELAAIEKPPVRNYNNPAMTTNSRSTLPSRSFRQPSHSSQLFAPAAPRELSVPQSANEPQPTRVAAVQQYEFELPVHLSNEALRPTRLSVAKRNRKLLSTRAD